MRLFLSFFITVIYALGSGLSTPSKPLAPSVKVQVEHTHEVAQGHSHHHDFENDGGHEDGPDASHAQNHKSQNEPKRSVPHSHEVSISMAGGCVLSFPAPLTVTLSGPVPALFPSGFLVAPPEDISLRSLFRPPIV